MKTAAIYARVSSDKQKEEQTIGSQLAGLQEYAQSEGYGVPSEWIFQDEGYSGANLQRPALECLRDLSAEGHIESIIIYSPDRLSRKYAYQVLLLEEFSRHGTEVVFIKSSHGSSPEDQLLVQFQGMIAEYERAQILERIRRGKKHKARNGSVNVLSGAPYGYRYIKKTDVSSAYYNVIEEEAQVVRDIYSMYTEECVSISGIAKRLTANGILTRFKKSVWDRSTVWGMLRNPAYKGSACFGKTEKTERQKITRSLRKRGGFSPRSSSSKRRAENEWIEISVPALISEETYGLAQEKLEKNKQFSARHTKEPTLLQGLLVCSMCGYAVYRTSTRTSKRKIYYYRCLGSDDYRYPKGRVCSNRPVRQDYLDDLVWQQVVQLLHNPVMIRAEIDKRISEAKNSNSSKKRKDSILKESSRVRKGIDRLLDAYQEGLLSLIELRTRSSELRKREKTLQSELASFENKLLEQGTYLQLVDKIDNFMNRLNNSVENLDILDRQNVLRLIVKEILVGPDTLTIKHSIPITKTVSSGRGNSGPFESEPIPPNNPAMDSKNIESCLLRVRSDNITLRCSFIRID